jgi:hypothetical protein
MRYSAITNAPMAMSVATLESMADADQLSHEAGGETAWCGANIGNYSERSTAGSGSPRTSPIARPPLDG